MNYKKFPGARTALLITIATLVLATAAGAASKYKTLYKFTGGQDGGAPTGPLIFDAVGSLYGTTQAGGDGEGTVFKLTPNPDGSWTEKVLHQFHFFSDFRDGYSPEAGLVFDTAGNLYGTTNLGGTGGSRGTVFELTPNSDGSWTESVIHSFTGVDGAYPRAGLIFDADGNLYGTTEWGRRSLEGQYFQAGTEPRRKLDRISSP